MNLNGHLSSLTIFYWSGENEVAMWIWLDFEMSNCFFTVKFHPWLLALGLTVCLGLVVFTQVVSRNASSVSSVSGFWMGTGQSFNVSLVIQVDAYRESTFENNEKLGNLSRRDDGVKFSSGSPTEGLSDEELHSETGEMFPKKTALARSTTIR